LSQLLVFVAEYWRETFMKFCVLFTVRRSQPHADGRRDVTGPSVSPNEHQPY
jgi:hypothetical protein